MISSRQYFSRVHMMLHWTNFNYLINSICSGKADKPQVIKNLDFSEASHIIACCKKVSD